MQVECVKDDDWLLHVEDLTDEHDLCEPGYPRLEAYADGVWHFKVQVRFMSDCHVLHDYFECFGQSTEAACPVWSLPVVKVGC